MYLAPDLAADLAASAFEGERIFFFFSERERGTLKEVRGFRGGLGGPSA